MQQQTLVDLGILLGGTSIICLVQIFFFFCLPLFIFGGTVFLQIFKISEENIKKKAKKNKKIKVLEAEDTLL